MGSSLAYFWLFLYLTMELYKMFFSKLVELFAVVESASTRVPVVLGC